MNITLEINFSILVILSSLLPFEKIDPIIVLPDKTFCKSSCCSLYFVSVLSFNCSYMFFWFKASRKA